MPRNPLHLPDNTPIIIGAGQHVQRLASDARPPFTPPAALAAAAAEKALADARMPAGDIDTISMIRLFSDSAPAWRSPFGGSNNLPESVAQRLGAAPEQRIYSGSGGTEPLERMREMLGDIARGERTSVLLLGAEAIASERFAARNGFSDDWNETHDVPLDDRYRPGRFALREEVDSGLKMPAHFYALIENAQAHAMGHSPEAHRRHMAELMAPLAAVAVDNPFTQKPTAYSAADLAATGDDNYPLALPLRKRLVAQDAVNQAAALVLTSVGNARAKGIDPRQWVFVTGYAEGEDRFLSQREDPGLSVAMQRVFAAALAMADARAGDMHLLDLYSCFPCAVHAARLALELPGQGGVPLTVTGGLPYFGGPGNNYCMHALAEMVTQLRGSTARGLVTANGGLLSRHAAAILTADSAGAAALDWTQGPHVVLPESIRALPLCAAPASGAIVTSTVVARRGKADVGVVLADTPGGRCLASTRDADTTRQLAQADACGRHIEFFECENKRAFRFASA